jgi:hypothetical protein
MPTPAHFVPKLFWCVEEGLCTFSGPCVASQTSGTRCIILKSSCDGFYPLVRSVVTSGSQWRAVSLTASAPSHRGDKALIRLLPSHSATSSSERFANCGTGYSHELRNCSSAKIPDSCVVYLKDFCKRFVH